jgi:hypothetical protein
MISLREHLRIHKASLHVVMQRAKSWPDPGGPRKAQVLQTRLDDAFQLLEYYDVTATSLLEQQQNLLSLVSMFHKAETQKLMPEKGVQSGDSNTRTGGCSSQCTGICFPPSESSSSEYPKQIEISIAEFDTVDFWNHDLYSTPKMVSSCCYSRIDNNGSDSLDCKHIF